MEAFSFIDNLNDKQIYQLHTLLQQMWWSRERTLDEVLIMLKNSTSFILIENGTQNLAGYARVLTDEIKYAFIFDVMVVDEHREKGLGKLIIDTIVQHPKLSKVKKFELTCAEDMVSFYEKFGFSKDYRESVPMMLETRN